MQTVFTSPRTPPPQISALRETFPFATSFPFDYRLVLPLSHLAAIDTQVFRHVAGSAPTPFNDQLACEEPLEIRVRGRGIAVTMRTPGHDPELAAGFLLSEGIVHCHGDIIEIAPCLSGDIARRGNILNVFLSPSVEINFERLTRHVFASSSCGLCGKASIDAVQQQFPPVNSDLRVGAEVIRGLPNLLAEAQINFAQTGGLHAAGIFSDDGRLLVAREDVGRHNAVDKVIGWGLLNRELPLNNEILMVSGRASFEIMQKALAARFPIVAAVSAPSSLAVEFARDSGQTLIGFLRGSTFNIYSNPQRIDA